VIVTLNHKQLAVAVCSLQFAVDRRETKENRTKSKDSIKYESRNWKYKIRFALSLRMMLEHLSAKGLYREVFEAAIRVIINSLTSKTSRYNWIPATAGIQSLEVTVFIPEGLHEFPGFRAACPQRFRAIASRVR